MSPIDVVVFALGALVAARVILSSIRTFILPRAANDTVARIVFRTTRRAFDVVTGPSKPYERRDQLMAYFGPVALVVLPAVWLTLVLIGYAAMFWAIGVRPIHDAIGASGSSLLTLGFARPAVPGADLLAFSEAMIGLGLVALLISYLPTIYGAFSRRELLVNLLEVRADSPPSPVVLITRFHRLHGLEALGEMWERWEEWYSDIEETHTSLSVLVHFRSQQPDHSWVNAAGAMMDAAAMVRSSVDIPMDVRADLMIRAGYLAVRRIAAVFHIPYDPAPSPATPTSIDRACFDEALGILATAGVPLVADRDQAWLDFNGWRVNYDEALRGLERLTVAPMPWWDRPMHSAWITDEPVAAVAAAHDAGSTGPGTTAGD